MPIKTILNSDINYYLICYDKDGNERTDDPDIPKLSDEVVKLAKSGKYTDIFFSSHGWKGDIPAAIDQYHSWMGAMLQCKQDIARLKSRPQGFNPLIIGLHWPSLPFGMEDHSSNGFASEEYDSDILDFGYSDDSELPEMLRKNIIDTITETSEGIKAVNLILNSAKKDPVPNKLSVEVERAINLLIAEGKTGSEDSAPGEDMPELSAKSLYEAIVDKHTPNHTLDFGASNEDRNFLVDAMTQLSIWRMKARARTFGEAGAAKLLRRLQSVTSPSVGNHLMGHSLGCIVVSSAITGKNAEQSLPRGVNSLYLVEGALSHWSYSKKIPISGKSGYYQSLSLPDFMSGPIIITHTHNDLAVCKIYPLAAKLSGVFSGHSFSTKKSYPKYGALGAHGAQGGGITTHKMNMLTENERYSYDQGHFYNIDSSQYMKKMEGFSGAHNDIAHAEVAHAFFEAIQ